MKNVRISWSLSVIWEGVKIFFIGILEDFLSSFNTKTIQRNNQFFSFLLSFISVLLWYYVIVLVVENLQRFWLILVYAFGGGFGDIVSIKFDRYISRFEMSAVGMLNSVRLRWPIEIVKRKIKVTKRGPRNRRLYSRGLLSWLKNLFYDDHRYINKGQRRRRRK